MWNNIVQTPARAFHRAFMKKRAMQFLVCYSSKGVDSPRTNSFIYCFLLQVTFNVYNLHIDMVMRRAPSRQQSNP
jgi:hypothetical protein